MENQHRHITGYRELSQEEIANINAIKQAAEIIGDMCLKLRGEIIHMPEMNTDQCAAKREALRWFNEGEMQAQQAFMSLTRAVARPTTF